jgi:hypothetical protein
MAPYITVPLLAYNVYKASRTPMKLTDLELTKPKEDQVSGILTTIGGALMILSQLWIVPMAFMWTILLPTYPPAMQPSMFQFTLFMLLFAATPIAIGVVVLISGMVISRGDLKTGGLLAMVFAIQSFSTFGFSLLLGAILALIGGALAYFRDAPYIAY